MGTIRVHEFTSLDGVIDNPACVAKTYPRFFEDLERLR